MSLVRRISDSKIFEVLKRKKNEILIKEYFSFWTPKGNVDRPIEMWQNKLKFKPFRKKTTKAKPVNNNHRLECGFEWRTMKPKMQTHFCGRKYRHKGKHVCYACLKEK